jgi:hypothetical protein
MSHLSRTGAKKFFQSTQRFVNSRKLIWHAAGLLNENSELLSID